MKEKIFFSFRKLFSIMDNEYIYFDIDKYIAAIKHTHDKNVLITMLKEAETTNSENIILSQKIVYDIIKKANGIYDIFVILKYFSNSKNYLHDLNNTGITLEKDSDVSDERKSSLIKDISNFSIFKIIFDQLKIKKAYDIINYKLYTETSNTFIKWIIENSDEHYKDETHFYETIGLPYKKFYLKYFENFTYPELPEKSVKLKLEKAINTGDLYFTEFWFKLYKGTEKITIDIYRDSKMYCKYKVVEKLIQMGFLENGGEWKDLTPQKSKGTIFEPLFETFNKKTQMEKYLKELEVTSKGMEIEIINFLVQKLKK